MNLPFQVIAQLTGNIRSLLVVGAGAVKVIPKTWVCADKALFSVSPFVHEGRCSVD